MNQKIGAPTKRSIDVRNADIQTHEHTPAAHWEIVDVEFHDKCQDLIIRHNLKPPHPEAIEYKVIRQATQGVVFEDRSPDRKPWGEGFIILRANEDNWTGRLELSVLKTPRPFRPVVDIESECDCPCEEITTPECPAEEAAPTLIFTQQPVVPLHPAEANVSVTPSGSSWANSDWFELVDSLPHDAALTHLTFKHGVNQVNFQVDISTGSPGNEDASIIAQHAGWAGNASFEKYHILQFPIPVGVIPAGTRLSIRMRKPGTSTTAWTFSGTYLNADELEDDAIVTNNPLQVWPVGGVKSITPNSTPWANSSWVEISSNTGDWAPAAIAAHWAGHGEFEFDLGVGGSGSEVVIGTFGGDDETPFFAQGPTVYPIWPIPNGLIPSGSRLSIRLRKESSNNSPTVDLNLLYYADFDEPRIETAGQFKTVPSAAAGVATDSGGGWEEVIASAATDLAITSVVSNWFSGSGTAIDIGFGSLGNETVKASLIIPNVNEPGSVLWGQMPYALNVPAGTRVSVRNHLGAGSTQAQAKFNYIENPDFEQRSFNGQKITDIETKTAWSGAAWVDSDWEFLATVNADSLLVGMYWQFSGATTQSSEIEIGVGPGGDENTLTTFRLQGASQANNNGPTYIPFPVPMFVPISTQLWFRGRIENGTATDLDVALAYFEPDANDLPTTGGETGNDCGQVIGPTTTTDDAIATWNGSEGGALQNSVITIPDSAVPGTLSGTNSGDVTVTGEDYLLLTNQQITAGEINLDNIVPASTDSVLLGRGDSGAGDFEEITLGSGLAMTGTTLSASGSGGADPNLTYLTENDETGDLPNSRRLLAGTNVTFDDTTPGERTINVSASGGDVTGPGSATDNAIARFDLTTGKIIQNSGITIADGASGTLAGTNSGDATLAGENYLSIAGQVITANAVDLSGTNVTGDLPFSKLAQASAADKLLGRGAGAGGGDYQEISLGTGLTMSGTTLSSTVAGTAPGDYVLSGSGNPQGAVTANAGAIYISTTSGLRYEKRVGSGNTGWYLDGGTARVHGPQFYPIQITDGSAGGISAGPLQITNLSGNAAIVQFSDGFYGPWTGNASANNTTGWNTQVRPQWWDDDFDIVAKIRTGATLTNTRFWFLVSTTQFTTSHSSDDVSGSAIGFRYSAGTDGGFVGYTRDGSNSSVTATVASIATSTNYTLRIRFVRSGTPTAYFSVDDGAETSKTNHIPATGSDACICMVITNKNNTTQTFNLRNACAIHGAMT